MATPLLKRGFKTTAEKLAKQYRIALNIHPCAPLCAFKLADFLNVPIYSATDFISTPSEIELLSGTHGKFSEWSALTMVTKANNRIIIHNPFNSVSRQQSDLMHELAHIICEHKKKPDNHNLPIPLGMRDFDVLQEEEARCLGGTLQLPTPSLLWAIKRDMNNEEIASHFNSSSEMVFYRLNMTGISKRMNRRVI